MRPQILNPLFAPLASLDGVGPQLQKAFDRLLVSGGSQETARVVDLLFHIPYSLIDRRHQPTIMDAAPAMIATIKVRVDRHQPPPGNSRVPYRVYCQDETGEIALTYFRGNKKWLEKLLPVGQERHVSGRPEWFNGQLTMVHPDLVLTPEDLAEADLVEPVYGLTQGLGRKAVANVANGALMALPRLPEWQLRSVIERQGWASFGDALSQLHNPRDITDLAGDAPPTRRLAYDELLAGQLALGLVRQQVSRHGGVARAPTGDKSRQIRDLLPFQLTDGQEQAIGECVGDLAKPERMLRLLQGDVGSGKTVVALLAMTAVVEAGAQAALMAPTEILVRQHFATLAPLCEAAGLEIALLTGREKGKTRAKIVDGLADGSIDMVVGTHALFQSDVEFHDLGLAVVDEQHRFGVHQRLALSRKSKHADLLIMTATPIPRTLVMTHFGDMEVSKLTEKPAGRQPVATSAMPLDRLNEIVERLRTALDQGQRTYWICPLVEESEELPLTSAEDRHAALVQLFGNKVGLVHGRMKGAEKDAAMAAFKAGDTQLLVATTVIEVGVDVPEASIMIVEHAERFGLAQLHQLRGRVGRGERASACILLYKGPLGETARARLSILRQTEDGFLIAEEDLKLRGEGELLGVRQSGMPGYRIADPSQHGDLLEMARDDAKLVLTEGFDPQAERTEALRILLFLFGKDEAVRLISAG